MTRLAQVLLGLSKPSEKIGVSDLSFFDPSLNPSQKEAVKFALESPEIACIHGPPGWLFPLVSLVHHIYSSSFLIGTGKTHTLIEIIRQLTSVTASNTKPLRLLVCGASNLSVDNILERLLALPAPEKGERLKITRVGHPARVVNHEGVLESTLEVKAGRSDQVCSPFVFICIYLIPFRQHWRRTSRLNLKPRLMSCPVKARVGRVRHPGVWRGRTCGRR